MNILPSVLLGTLLLEDWETRILVILIHWIWSWIHPIINWIHPEEKLKEFAELKDVDMDEMLLLTGSSMCQLDMLRKIKISKILRFEKMQRK